MILIGHQILGFSSVCFQKVLKSCFFVPKKVMTDSHLNVHRETKNERHDKQRGVVPRMGVDDEALSKVWTGGAERLQSLGDFSFWKSKGPQWFAVVCFCLALMIVSG